MPSSRQLLRAIGLACAMAAAGCVNNEAAALVRAEARLAKADAAAARVELKNLVQAYPKSGQVRLLAGTRLLADGEFSAAVAELERALEFGAAPASAVPLLAEAMLQSGQASRMLLNLDTTDLGDPPAQARLLASVARARLLAGQVSQARTAVTKAGELAPGSAQVWLARADLAAQDGDLREALSALDAALAADPRYADAWMLRGDLLGRRADGRAEARQAYAKAVDSRPNQAAPRLALMAAMVAQGDLDGARTQLAELKLRLPGSLNTMMAEGQIAFVAGDHHRAREVFQGLLRVMPDNLPLLLTAGENELQLGAAQQAEAHFAKASALAPRNPTARRLLARAQLRLGQTPKALNTLEPLVDAPDASVEVLALAAEASRLNGDTRQAQQLLDRLSARKPDDPRLRTMLALASLGQQDEQQVTATLREIAASDSGTAADLALFDRLLARGQHDGALQVLDGLARKLPDDPMPLRLRGQLLASQQQLEPARAALDAALALRPDDASTLVALAALDLRQGQAERARGRLAALLKAQPKNPLALLAQADLLARQGAPAETVRLQIAAAVQAAPDDLSARTALVQHHLRQGQSEAALNAAQTATAAMPDNLELLDLLGRCQLGLRQTSQALSTYGRIATLAPKSPRGHLGMAEVQLAAGQFELAQRSIQRALDLAPGDVAARTLAVRAALGRNQPARAVEIARQLQADRPAEAVGFVLEGEVHMRQQQWSAAAAALHKALEKSGAGMAAALLFRSLDAGERPADAQRFATQRLASHPRDAGLLFAMAEAAQRRGDLAAAQTHYERVLDLQPEHLPALNNLALVHLARKQAGALPLAQRAAALAPRQAEVLDTLAQAQAAGGSIGNAIASQREAVGAAPDQPAYRLALARLLVRNGDRAEAWQQLNRLAALGSGFSAQDEVASLLQSVGAPAR